MDHSSYSTAVTLSIVDVKVNAVADEHPLVTKYPNLFNGIGNLKDFEVQLHIDKSVCPFAQRQRKIPFHM